MPAKPELRVDWATHEASKHAVEKWHYSKRLPMPPLVKVGAWENKKFVGVFLFGRGANNSIGDQFGLDSTQACELVRVAFTKHATPISRVGAIAMKWLKKHSPGLRLIVSYADEEQGHHGGIYQAMGWVYVGRSQGGVEFFHEGRWKHSREVMGGAFGGARKVKDHLSLPKRKTRGKHKYLMPLDAEMKAKILSLSKPYPRRHASASSETVEHPSTVDGAAPIRTLNDSTARVS
jgi:hypothetical protein